MDACPQCIYKCGRASGYIVHFLNFLCVSYFTDWDVYFAILWIYYEFSELLKFVRPKQIYLKIFSKKIKRECSLCLFAELKLWWKHTTIHRRPHDYSLLHDLIFDTHLFRRFHIQWMKLSIKLFYAASSHRLQLMNVMV